MGSFHAIKRAARRLRARLIGRAESQEAAGDPCQGGMSPETLPQRMLREDSARYLAIVETAVDAIVVADRLGKIRSFNRAAESIFGYSPEEVVGENIRLLMPEPDQSRHDGYLASYRRTGERKIIGIGREVQGRRKDGTMVPLELSIAEWRDIDGQQCFTGIMRDVSVRNQQGRDLQRATELADQARIEAEAANHAKTEFLAVMSHEIRTPLTSINGFTDLLSKSGRFTREQRRYIELIRTANAALLTIVNDILDFSKVEAGQLELERRSFSPQQLIHDTIAIVSPVAAGKQILLKYVVAPNVPDWVMGDDARLRQVLLNLLNNSVKFTHEGSIRVTLRAVRTPEGEERLHFAVTDTGIGIPESQHHRLFKQFSQADGSVSRRHGGTGLGLAICKRLVDLMEGEIGVISSPTKGTTMWFTAALPEAAPRAAAVAATGADSTPATAMAEGYKARILLVDDLETNQEIVKAYLEDGGYQVVAAGGGVEALEQLGRDTFDLVLMDIQMPVMDGVTATRAIRAMDGPVRDIPIIAMTGNVLPQQVRSFIQAGMNDHVGKPIERNNLYMKVWRWLPNHATASHAAPAALSLLNRPRLQELIDVIGPDKTERTMLKFHEQLAAAFQSGPEAARREAHDLINVAGVLGFDALMEVARALSNAGDEHEAERLMGQCRQVQREVLDHVAGTLLPELSGTAMRISA
jgi:PAS domain S-box-containing protein